MRVGPSEGTEMTQRPGTHKVSHIVYDQCDTDQTICDDGGVRITEHIKREKELELCTQPAMATETPESLEIMQACQPCQPQQQPCPPQTYQPQPCPPTPCTPQTYQPQSYQPQSYQPQSYQPQSYRSQPCSPSICPPQRQARTAPQSAMSYAPGPCPPITKTFLVKEEIRELCPKPKEAPTAKRSHCHFETRRRPPCCKPPHIHKPAIGKTELCPGVFFMMMVVAVVCVMALFLPGIVGVDIFSSGSSQTPQPIKQPNLDALMERRRVVPCRDDPPPPDCLVSDWKSGHYDVGTVINYWCVSTTSYVVYATVECVPNRTWVVTAFNKMLPCSCAVDWLPKVSFSKLILPVVNLEVTQPLSLTEKRAPTEDPIYRCDLDDLLNCTKPCNIKKCEVDKDCCIKEIRGFVFCCHQMTQI